MVKELKSEQVVENDEFDDERLRELTEGTIVLRLGIMNRAAEASASIYPYRPPIIFVNEGRQQPWSNRWIPEGDRYFLIKCRHP